jgi:hypothetical protein
MLHDRCGLQCLATRSRHGAISFRADSIISRLFHDYFVALNRAFKNSPVKNRQHCAHFSRCGRRRHAALFCFAVKRMNMIDKSKFALSLLFEMAQRFYHRRTERALMRFAPTRRSVLLRATPPGMP